MSSLAVALDKVKEKAQRLAATMRSEPEAADGARSLADLLDSEAAFLEKARQSADVPALRRALVFSALDARAADAMGGYSFRDDEATQTAYLELLDAIIAAREEITRESTE